MILVCQDQEVQHPSRLHRPALRRLGAVVVAASVLVGATSAAGAATIDKSWSNRLGAFKSQDWSTSRTRPQTLTFKTCSHNWSGSWGNGRNVTVKLQEVKAWMPDVTKMTGSVSCNNARQPLVSGNTNSTKYHFDYQPNVSARTNGTMTVTHSV